MSRTLQILTLCLLVTVTSCKEEYPDLEDGLYAEIVTSKDTMVAKLFYKKVPVTVANFVALAEGNHPMVSEEFKGKPFYDSLTFHRVMDKFMIQGGDHTATGSGNPGYKFTADFDPSLKHDKGGILSMANGGGINTNGSQFFITEVPYPSLDAYDAEGNLKPCDQPRVSCHSVFGELVKGIEVQDSISNVKVGARNKPLENVYITKVNIIRKGSDAKSFNAAKTFEEQLPVVEEEFAKIKEDARLKAEEEQRIREEKTAEASKALKPILDEYNSKTTTLASGLKKYVITEGTGAKVKEGDKAMISYEGYFTDGRLFDSNDQSVAEKYGMFDQRRLDANMYGPTEMPIRKDAQMIAGFKEAIASMKVGERAFFYIPSHLAYGERGRGGIKPNTDLTFILEMTGIAE
ncbi:peptidylprolyl isomerase [Psychroserpens algicola]|uniref:peptidylprolyl isomerase n=1 Tax=Psychroserpens algicola TaxID=1719034 RepID=A0ABT0HC87_9FLAO|nr:peptidylprolyl isomerase [Psychroserpens algicola]MCK8481462.1 peptidylprolyl isomerase [Psychroserpens algicola]